MLQLILSQQNTKINLLSLLMLLYVLSTTACISAPNPVSSLMFLILSFFNLSLFLLLMGLEFLSLLTLLVYVGSICILFIFVLMILNLKMLILKNYFFYKMLFISLITFISIILILTIFDFEFSIYFKYFNTRNPYVLWSSLFFSSSDLEILGRAMFTKYIFHFVIGTLILFSVMIGSVCMVTEKKKTFIKTSYLNSKESDFLHYDFNKIKTN